MRQSWSRMRSLSLLAFLACAVLVVGTYVSSIAYTGKFQSSPEFWLLVLAKFAALVVFAIAWRSDQITERQDRILAQLEDIELRILDYGDKREASGHLTATRVTRTQTGRPIHPVS